MEAAGTGCSQEPVDDHEIHTGRQDQRSRLEVGRDGRLVGCGDEGIVVADDVVEEGRERELERVPALVAHERQEVPEVPVTREVEEFHEDAQGDRPQGRQEQPREHDDRLDDGVQEVGEGAVHLSPSDRW